MNTPNSPMKNQTPTDKSPLKTVVITGAGTGIGFELAKNLRDKGGYRLVLVGRDREKLESSAKDLGGNPDLVHVAVCDLADSQATKKTADRLRSTFNEIYGLVNNAGIYPFGGTLTTTEAQWDETFAVNLKSAFLLIQGLQPSLAKSHHGARIVNVSSTAGILPNHFALAYSVSKAAMIQLTRTMAKELGKDNITVNCVCPGIVRSPLHEAYHNSQSELEEFYGRRGSTFPMGRVGEPKDVASAIQFFLSEDASWITGDVMITDGGRLLL